MAIKIRMKRISYTYKKTPVMNAIARFYKTPTLANVSQTSIV